jgi:ribonuclease HI
MNCTYEIETTTRIMLSCSNCGHELTCSDAAPQERNRFWFHVEPCQKCNKDKPDENTAEPSTTQSPIILYVDGSGWNGECSRFVVTDFNGEPIQLTILDEQRTNNEMEYSAMLWACEHASDGTTIVSDSQLVVHQVNGEWAVYEDRLVQLCRTCRDLKQRKNLKIQWVQREKNVAGKYFM